MTEYTIEITERIEFRFKILAENEEEATEIAKGSWEVYSPINMEVITDSDVDIKVYDSK